jgi:hypothetical protein
VQALLSKLGLKLACVSRDVAPDGRRGGSRVYAYQPPEDGRDIIFAHWQKRDVISQESQDKAIDTPSSPAMALVSDCLSDPPPDI